MNKKCFVVHFIVFLAFFFLFNGYSIKANEGLVINYPVSSQIIYGQPLYMSSLSGGVANMDGVFVWEDELLILDAGQQKAKAKFIPNNSSYEPFSFDVDVDVAPRKVYLKFEKELCKKYDGNNVLYSPGYVVRGIIDKDVYVMGNINLTLDSVFVGNNIGVNISGLELGGERKNNYYLDLEGFTATIYPDHVGKFGENDRISFVDDIYVPLNSFLHVNIINSDLSLDKHDIKTVYEIAIKSDDIDVGIEGKVSVKIKIDKKNLKYKRLELFNYYNNEFERINFEYKDGYLIYDCNNLGLLVITEREFNFWWIYVFGIFILSIILFLIVRKVLINRKKINKYKSLKRRKDYGDY